MVNGQRNKHTCTKGENNFQIIESWSEKIERTQGDESKCRKKISPTVICGKTPELLLEQSKPKRMQQKMVLEEDRRSNKDAKIKM